MTTSRTYRSVSPPLPGLSRASTPESNAPATPVMQSAFPRTGKMGSQRVGIASPPVSSAYRIPGYDERFVMRSFASHASHCDQCSNPEQTRRQGQTLCRTGTVFAKDLGKYFFCYDGKPYSTIDRDQRGERVQVEVPLEYAVVKTLFEALARGLQFTPLKQRRPEVHQYESRPAPARTHTTSESYEIKPSRTTSRRDRANTYTGHTTETRTPFDAPYREVHEETPRHSQRQSKRGSLYVADERQTTTTKKSYPLLFSFR